MTKTITQMSIAAIACVMLLALALPIIANADRTSARYQAGLVRSAGAPQEDGSTGAGGGTGGENGGESGTSGAGGSESGGNGSANEEDLVLEDAVTPELEDDFLDGEGNAGTEFGEVIESLSDPENESDSNTVITILSTLLSRFRR